MKDYLKQIMALDKIIAEGGHWQQHFSKKVWKPLSSGMKARLQKQVLHMIGMSPKDLWFGHSPAGMNPMPKFMGTYERAYHGDLKDGKGIPRYV